MDPIRLGRVTLPLLVAASVATLVVWPVLRLHRESGARVVTLHRRGTPGQRVSAPAFLAVVLGIIALALAYAAGGPGAVGGLPPSATAVWLGTGAAAAGLGIVAAAQRQMGSSFRIGIDEAPTPLVEAGLFRWVRNPIYSGLLLMLAGVVLIAPGVWSAALWIAAAGAIAWHTRLEERHLLALHGESYRRYAERTGRFVPGVGRGVGR
jgi:protein-S-isoprenylcysteine O-methyltransferase Ste14